MTDLKKLLLACVAASGLCLCTNIARAEDAKPITGTLIDNMCGEKKADEAAAASHTVKCATKESCAGSGYQLIVGDKHYKLDDKGNEQAKAYLKGENPSLKVTIEGKADGDKLSDVTSIKAAEKEAK